MGPEEKAQDNSYRNCRSQCRTWFYAKFSEKAASLAVTTQQFYPLVTIGLLSRLVSELVNSFFKIWKEFIG